MPNSDPTPTERAPNFRPLSNNLLVRRDRTETITPEGIHIPTQAREKPRVGTVIRTGPGRPNLNDGLLIPMFVHEGDRIVFPSFAGNELSNGNSIDEYLILCEDDVIAILDDQDQSEETSS